MFDLNQAIGNWRAQLKAMPEFRDTDLDELEDHLREQITELTTTGLSEEEAFLVSARRLGDPQVLACEFAVASPDQRRRYRLRWMVVGALALLLLRLVGDVLANLVAGTSGFLPLGGRMFGLTGGVLQVTALLIGGLIIWRLLATDSTARRISRLGFLSSAKVGGMIVATAAVLLVALAGTTLFGSRMFALHQLPQTEFVAMSVIATWFRLGILLILPILLILLLWRLSRPLRN